MNENVPTDKRYRLYLIIIAGAIALRLITFLLSTNYGADSITRSLITLKWSFDPFLIWRPNASTSVWLPFPFYVNGIILMIWDNVALAPRLTSLFLSLASLPVFYLLSRRLFSKDVSLASLACYAVFTMHIKHGNIASSESMYIFCILAAIYLYERLLTGPRWGIIAALSVSLAGAVMTRFEPWILPLFMIVASMLSPRSPGDPPRKVTIRATIIASIPPGLLMLIWLYGSYREFGDALYSLHEAAAEHARLTDAFAGSGGRLRVILYNAAFWPGTLLLGLSPFIFVGGLWGMIRAVIEKHGITWVLFAGLILGIYYYKSTVTGELAPLARYTILPGAIICLFAAPGIYDLAARIRPGRRGLIVFAVLLTGLISAISLSGNYINAGDPLLRRLAAVSPITNYPGSLSPVIGWLEKHIRPDDRVMFSTPAYASNSIVMYSGIRPEQIIPVNESDPDAMIEEMGHRRPTLLILHRDSPLYGHLGFEPSQDFLTIGDENWRVEGVGGEFVIYRATL